MLVRNCLCFAGLILLTTSCSGADVQRTDAPIAWILGRSGKDHVSLQIPAGFESADRAAQAMNHAVYGDQPPDTRYPPHQEMLLTALWPGLEPQTIANRAEFNIGGGGRLMMALLQSSAVETFENKDYNALQAAYDVAVKFSTEMLCVPLAMGPPYTTFDKHPCYKRAQPDVKSPQFGLQRVGVDFSKYPDMMGRLRYSLAQNDIYYARDSEGQLQIVIWCTAEESEAGVPQCKQIFVNKKLNALVSVGYRRVYLQDWQRIRAAWEQLLDSFIVDVGPSPEKGA
jgi:hypothetical protein